MFIRSEEGVGDLFASIIWETNWQRGTYIRQYGLEQTKEKYRERGEYRRQGSARLTRSEVHRCSCSENSMVPPLDIRQCLEIHAKSMPSGDVEVEYAHT